MHEYKRQLLNVLHILMLYNELKEKPGAKIMPRVFIFAGKSAPGYTRAKLIVKLINSVAELVNSDPDVKDKIKVVFLANYGVSLAERIIPAADVSEQISTAGKEASGTGNMKFALNGALTIGTLDGANVEIKREVGDDNIYIFGLKAEDIERMELTREYNPSEYYEKYPEIRKAVDLLKSDELSGGDPGLFKPLFDSLLYGSEGNTPDQYFLLADLISYRDTQKKIAVDYRDKLSWQKKALHNISNMGFFSSDRAIRAYADEIWNVKSVPVEL